MRVFNYIQYPLSLQIRTEEVNVTEGLGTAVRVPTVVHDL